MIADDDEYDCCDYAHETGIACSCAVALEIERHGLSSTLHCRFTLDGQRCSHSDCPYSHANLGVDHTRTPPHCIICGEFLGKALQHPGLAFCLLTILSRVSLFGLHETRLRHVCGALGSPALSARPGSYFGLYMVQIICRCADMQNAGCGHLHHAHCLHMGNDDTTVTSCPSGCPQGTFPREAAIFDRPTPHIIVAWDGDKIDYIPIPAPQGDFAQSGPLRLSSEEVVSLVRKFLSGKGFALPGLFLRIHLRDAVTEYDFVLHLFLDGFGN